MLALAPLAGYWVALYSAHQVADHWIQTQWQVDHKGLPGWRGRLACLAHVGTYGVTQLAALVALVLVADVAVNPGRLAAGLAVSLVTHYTADRRTPLRRVAEWTGSARFYALGTPRPGRDDNPSLGTGAYALDQSWHVGFIFVAALVMAA